MTENVGGPEYRGNWDLETGNRELKPRLLAASSC